MVLVQHMDEEAPIFADERHNRIAELVAAKGKVLTSHLTSLLGVSEPTLRKDLTILEQRGLLKRTHGGAIAARPPAERELDVRSTQNLSAKEAIAAACLEEIADGEAIFLDSGTTVQLLAHELGKSNRRVTVVSNAPKAAAEVALNHGISHILLGGQLRIVSGSLTGPLTAQNLNLFTINTAFIGVSGITKDGITVSDFAEAQLKMTVIDRAQKIIVPVDHTKIGAVDFTKVCGLDQIDVVVTDQADPMLEKVCGDRGIRVVIAGLSRKSA
jgi:DeoR/GlpR family transcriptional regulator of sugar metabolism